MNFFQFVYSIFKEWIFLFKDIFIPICAICVSVLVYLIYRKQALIQGESLETSKRQIDIQKKELEQLEKQLLLQRQDFLPRFQIKIFQKSTYVDNIVDTEFLEVINDGYFITDYMSKITSYIQFNILDCLSSKNNCYRIPVNGYFALCSKLFNQKGTLETRFDAKNNYFFHQLYNEVQSHSTDKQIYSIYLFSLFEIKYRDFELTVNEKFYRISSVVYEISKKDYKDDLSIIENFIPVEYSSLNFIKLINIKDSYTVYI